MQEHETFLSLLGDAAHWEFELFLMFIFDVIIGLLCWPFIKKHWKHHVESDAIHGFDDNPKPANKHIWTMRYSLCVCKKCGIVQHKDNRNNSCNGVVKVILRSKNRR